MIAPTIVGNVWASLISLLQLQYGLHLVGTLGIDRHMAFIFMRLWFLLDHAVRHDVSEALAIYEALIGVTLVVSFGSLALLTQTLVRWLVGSAWEDIRVPLIIALSLVLFARLLYRMLVRETIGAVVAFEALFGRISRGDLDRLIEEAKKAIDAQAKGIPATSSMTSKEDRG